MSLRKIFFLIGLVLIIAAVCLVSIGYWNQFQAKNVVSIYGDLSKINGLSEIGHVEGFDRALENFNAVLVKDKIIIDLMVKSGIYQYSGFFLGLIGVVIAIFGLTIKKAKVQE